MRFYKAISIAAFAVISISAIPAKADIVPVSCTWTLYSQTSGPNATYITEVCKNGSTQVATRNRQYGAGTTNSCSLSPYSPYVQTGGTCESPTFGLVVVTKQCLRPNQVWGTYNVGLYPTPAPSQATLDAYCGTGCNNIHQQISSNQYGATIQITCGTTTN